MPYLDTISTILASAVSAKGNLNRSIANAKDMSSQLRGNKSIARGALDGTLQFPCLISDSIPIDKAATMAKTLEQVYASFAQIQLSLNNTMDISVDKNPSMFLQRFHHNVKLESTVQDLYNEYCMESDKDYDKLMERIYDGSTKAFINERANRMIVFNFSNSTFPKEMYEKYKEDLEEHLSSIDFQPFPNIGNSPYYEADDDSILQKSKTMSKDEIKQQLELHTAKKSIEQNLIQQQKDAERYANKQDKLDYADYKVPSLLKDSEVKKQNDLQPYLMQVRLMAINDKNEFVQFLDFVIGIKVVLHCVKSDEMIANLQNVMNNTGKLFNFIRWTTGEKSLFKDLLLRINDTKLDVANRSKGASPWWMTLKRMKETSKAQGAFFSRTQFVPNSTIVISSYEADIIQKNYGYNLKDPKTAKRIMDGLFLMNFAIIDDGTRTVDILYDGHPSYQTYALETLEREVSMNSNKLSKELTRMLSR